MDPSGVQYFPSALFSLIPVLLLSTLRLSRIDGCSNLHALFELLLYLVLY